MKNKVLKFRARLAKAIIGLAYDRPKNDELEPFIRQTLGEIEGHEIKLYGINASVSKIKNEILKAAIALEASQDDA